MFGVSAKERMAQLQQKGAKGAEVGKLPAGVKPIPGKLTPGPSLLKKPEPKALVDPKKPATPQLAKPKEEPKKPAAAATAERAKPKEVPKIETVPEPAKPKEQPKKQVVPEPAKPKEEPKTAAAPEPAKPKEEPKKPVVPEPAKPKEEPKKPAAPEPAKPKEEPKKPVVPEPAKPKEEPKKSVVPEPAKPKEEPKKPAVPGPAKPKEEPKQPEPAKPVKPATEETKKPATAAPPSAEVKKPSEDFFRGIFYFSGMGSLVGSALAEGVYVSEKVQRNALDSDDIEAARERQRLRRGEEIIATARNQAQGLSTDFRHLQALLESLPTFTEVLEPQPLDRRAVDQVIHGHVYFQQEQHPAAFHARTTHHAEHHPPEPAVPVTAEISSHQPQPVKRPVGGVAVLPGFIDQKHPKKEPQAGSFAAAIDEFDRVTAFAQQPVLAHPPPPEPPQAPESSRTHHRERPASEVPLAPGGTRPYGVHTGQVDVQASSWQERYGQAEVTKFQAPRPFSATGGEIDSKGIKSWQLSHLRTLEAKGYQIVSDSEKDAVKSYAPYLVSDRSQGADRQRVVHPRGEAPSPQAPFRPSPTFPVDTSALPYSDL